MASLRLAIGLLTVLPVAMVSADRRLAGRAMLLAPVVGVLLAVPLGLLGWAAASAGLGPLLTAVLVVAALAVLTRGLHLDGLADVADGLGRDVLHPMPWR